MAYVNFLEESMSVRGIVSMWLKLIPYAAWASLKLAALMILFNAFAVFMSFSLYKGDNYNLFLSISMGLSLFCFSVNYILGYSSVKIMQDGVNGVKQDVLGAIGITIKKIIKIFASTLLFYSAIYFTISPSLYLPVSLRRWYLLILAIIYVFFLPYILFYPWMIMLENKSVFDSFRASYQLVKERWLKYALLFFVSTVIIFFFVLGLIFIAAALGIWLNWDASWSLWRLNQSLGTTMPFNIRAAILFTELGAYGIKTMLSLMGFFFFSIYIMVLGLNIYVLVLAISYKTLNDYKRLGDNARAAEQELKHKTAEQELLEIAELFKDVKEITIDTTQSDSFDTSAIGVMDRSEALRQFNKEDEDIHIYGRIKPIIHEYPDPVEDEEEKPS